MQDAIRVDNLGKWFSLYHAKKPVTIMEAALAGLQRMRPVEKFWALRHVSFTVAPGEMMGVIGHNGAGKSTLLQILGKVAYPTEGRLCVNGRIGALLDLGASFHGDLTGRENVFVTAIVAGLSRREVARRFEAIVAFAQMEAFIDNPVRTYSTGMMMRLAFSVAVHTDPQVLLVDEFLSVGDLAFQTTCLQRIAELKQQGCAIVLVSHDVEQVQSLCDQALWLRRGEVAAYGEPTVVVGQYTTEMRSQTQALTPDLPARLTRSGQELQLNENRFGSQEMEIIDVHLSPADTLKPGEPLSIQIFYHSYRPIPAPIFSVTLSRDDGQVCLDVNTRSLAIEMGTLSNDGCITLQLDRLDLIAGEYFVDVGIYEKDWAYAYDYHWHVYSFWIQGIPGENGVLHPPMRWSLDTFTGAAGQGGLEVSNSVLL